MTAVKASQGKVWAWAGFGLGVAVSVAGNVAHTYHPSAVVLRAAGKTADQWRPELGAQLMAAFFPVALLVTVEVLARVQWPRTWGWSATRYGSTSLVAIVAAIVSYGHLNGLMRAYGEDDLTALIGPLSVDGLMVLCGFALIAIGRSRPVPATGPEAVATGPLLPYPAMTETDITGRPQVGPAPVLGSPVATTPDQYGTGRDHLSQVLPAEGEPAASTVTGPGSFALVGDQVADTRTPPRPVVPGPSATGLRAVVTDPDHVDLRKELDGFTAGPGPVVATAQDHLPEAVATGPEDGRDHLADEEPEPTEPGSDAASEAELATARDRYAEMLATGALPSIRTLRKELRVGHPKAKSIHDALSTNA